MNLSKLYAHLVASLLLIIITLPISSSATGSERELQLAFEKRCALIFDASQNSTWDLVSRLPSLQEVESFGPDSIALIKPEIKLNEDEVSTLMEKLKALGGSQQVQRDYSYDDRATSYPDLLLSPVSDQLDYLASNLKKAFLEIYGYRPSRMYLVLRVTSSEHGFSITKGNGGDHNGLHKHYIKPGEDSIDLVLSLRGLGSRIQFSDGIIRNLPMGAMALFGSQVMHGSPDSETDRLFLVGSVNGVRK